MVALLKTLFGMMTRKSLAEEVEDYVTVQQSLKNVEIPPEQITNINALLDLEKEYLVGSSFALSNLYKMSRYKLINWYKYENDRTLYETFVNGEDECSQNYRGTVAYVKEVKLEKPEAVILVHGMGKRLDFSLVDKLLNE